MLVGLCPAGPGLGDEVQLCWEGKGSWFIEFPGSFPSESQVSRDCIPFPKAMGLLGGHLLQTQTQ